jgi:NIPSNAP
MILTMRTWQVAREHYAEFARLSEDDFWPEFERLDGRPLALWVARVGMQERVVLMTRYASLEHWLSTRSWGAAAAKLKALTDRREKLHGDTDLIALLPLSHRQPAANAPEAEPGWYVLERWRVEPQQRDQFRSLTEDRWLPWAEADGRLRLVGCWRSYVGPADQVLVLLRATAMSDWDARTFAGGSDGAANTPENAAACEALMQRRAIAEPLATVMLSPLTRRRP